MAEICIVAHYAYGSLTASGRGHVGGVERQTSLMSQWLAKQGHDVSVITWDEGQPDSTTVDSVRIIKLCRQDAGLPGLRFFYPRWTSLVRALKTADANVYYQNCAEYVTGQVALWCRVHNRRFIYSVASEPDCDPRLPTMKKFRDRVFYRYGLRHANTIVVQTQKQRQMLQNGFALESRVFPMPCSGPMGNDYRPPQSPSRTNCRVLWVGRIARVKRLELLVELAEVLPDVRFDIVGAVDADWTYAERVIAKATALRNVKLHGLVSRDQMPSIYEAASIVCCTSLHEGFPNTFLEAWSHGLPIVSTVDPDDLIVSRRLGITASSQSSLASAIKCMIEHEQVWNEMSANARRYYLDNHAVDPVMRRYEALIEEMR